MFRTLLNDTKLQNDLKLDPKKALYIHFDIPPRNIVNRTLFGVTKKYTNVHVSKKKWDNWNKITDYLILGTIPTLAECDKIHAGLIMSVVDYFELGGNIAFLDEIATPLDWHKRGVKQFSLPMLDFGAKVPVECIVNAIDKIDECVKSGKPVYDHCKAGRGRSAMLLTIYLATHDKSCQGKTTEETMLNAIKKIKEKRIQISLDGAKRKKAIEAIIVINAIKNKMAQQESKHESKEEKPTPILSSNLPKSLATLLSLTETKAEIAQLTYFKELAIYAAFHDATTFGKSKRKKMIQELFNRIYSAENAEWYLDYHKNVAAFLNADPWMVWDNSGSKRFGIGDKETDKENRKQLVQGFLNELTDYLENKLNCEKGALKKSLLEGVADKKEESKLPIVTALKVVGGIAAVGVGIGMVAYQMSEMKSSSMRGPKM